MPVRVVAGKLNQNNAKMGIMVNCKSVPIRTSLGRLKTILKIVKAYCHAHTEHNYAYKTGSLLEAQRKLWGTKNATTATINIIKGINLIISSLSFAKNFIIQPSFLNVQKPLSTFFI